MRVKQLIKLCTDMADLHLPTRYQLCGASEALQDVTVQKFVNSCNAVLEDLYCTYCTDIATSKVVCKDGVIDVSGLCLNRVLKLTDGSGQNVKYRYTAEGLHAEDGEYMLTYAKLPPSVYWDEEIVLPCVRLTERMLAYGVLAEYFLTLGDLQLSAMWDARYQNALRTIAVKSSSMTLPICKWI